MLVEQELIEKARGGDGAAFNDIVLAYRKRIIGTISRLIGRPEDVEDVAQEVFVRLYYSLDQLRTPEVFEPWLYRLTVNASYDYLRRARRRNESRMSDLSEQQVLMADALASGRQEGVERQKGQVRDFVDALFQHVSEEDRHVVDPERGGRPISEGTGKNLQRQRECDQSPALSGAAKGFEGLQ